MTFRTATVFLLASALCSAAHLSQSAERAFQTYITALEMRLESQHSRPDTYVVGLSRVLAPPSGDSQALLAGAVQVEAVNGGSWQVSGGLMHHWRAAALIPDATPQSMLALLRDYGALPRYYAPEVVSSRVLTDDGESAIIAMQFKKQQVITVVLDAEFETQAGLDDANRGYSISRSTHVWQVDHPGSPQERHRPEGDDDGFLWRLNSYWSFEQIPQGLLIECEAVSLTRDVPAGLGWLIRPIIETLPRASLEFTLRATKNALSVNAMRRHNVDRAN
jgi:hypothetical protein